MANSTSDHHKYILAALVEQWNADCAGDLLEPYGETDPHKSPNEHALMFVSEAFNLVLADDNVALYELNTGAACFVRISYCYPYPLYFITVADDNGHSYYAYAYDFVTYLPQNERL